ncbi:MAG TPA: DUF72 domain-containing protein [Bacilli bacterium]|nr:DUF72 domain-containing protein [Bacilli bacterium]
MNENVKQKIDRVQIGLIGWNGHPLLDNSTVKDKLQAYAVHFPIVEVESSFYAIQPQRNFEKWARVTPPDFSFVVKAYQGMTGHRREDPHFQNQSEMYEAFLQSIRPVQESGKLKAVLFQYPPWFDCTRQHVDALRYAKDKMGDLPVALEFRNQSWFTPQMHDKTLSFMEREGWIHSIADEPQAGVGSVPAVLHATNPHLTLVRFHGRNVQGWTQTGEENNWRQVRYLYRYSEKELLEWQENLLRFQKDTEEICVLFNNNSGGHAALNAKEFMQFMGIEYQGEVAGQLNLFDL